MNELIENIFADFKVSGKKIPVAFLHYDGNSTTYVTYQAIDMSDSFSADDELLNYVDYYDFDVYSKGNYFEIIKELKKILKNNGFVWQPSKSSGDMYEDDTGYYHRTLNFAIERESDI